MRSVPKAIFTGLVPHEQEGRVALTERGRPVARIRPDAWAVLQQVDGARTVDGIATSLDLPGGEVWRLLDGLADAGLISPLAPPAGTAPLRRRQLLTGALLAGGSLGLTAAAPALAAAEQERKKNSQEKSIKLKARGDAEADIKARTAKEPDAKRQHTLAQEESAKKASKTGASISTSPEGPSPDVKKAYMQAKEEKKK